MIRASVPSSPRSVFGEAQLELVVEVLDAALSAAIASA